MGFSIEFYESTDGHAPVQKFLDELGEIRSMTKRTNFDDYLARQLCDPAFARRYRQAEEEWNVALQLAALREARGLTQREVARLVGTTQQQISRMESADYRGHALSTLRKVVAALGGSVRVFIEPTRDTLRPPCRSVPHRARHAA